MIRVVFLGTPEFAVPSLRALIEHRDLEVVGVITQPDRPAGRGRMLHPSPIKEYAQGFGLPIFQPGTLRTPESEEQIYDWQPDMLVVTAFGQILPPSVLGIAPYGSINVHASLLPRWRGAAPIQYAVRAGDQQTGITIMKMDEGLDTGPVLFQQVVPIAPDETGASLHDKLAELGATILPRALRAYLAGDLVPQPQPEQGVTLAPTLSKADGQILWSETAVEIDRQVRAYNRWPGTFTHFKGTLLKVIEGIPFPDRGGAQGTPGTILVEGNALAVQTGQGLYTMSIVQPAGKKHMTGQAFLAGHADAPGTILGAR